MFKLVVLSCLVSVAFGGYVHAPAYEKTIVAPATYAQVKTVVEPQVSVVATPTIEHVGTSYKNVPTGVSHHSSSVVHSHANIVEPVYAHGVQKTVVSTPVVKKVVEHVPAVVAEPYYAKTIVAAEPSYYAAAPVAKTISYAAAPAHYASYEAAPAHYASYAAAPAHYASYAAAPVAYAAAPAHSLAYSSAVYAPKALNYAAAYPSAYSAYPAASYAKHW